MILCCSRWIHLLTLYKTYFFGVHEHPHFYSHSWLLPGNTPLKIFLGCRYHHTGTWRTLQCSATDVQHHDRPRVGHVHPQSWLIQLPMNNCLNSDNLFDLVSSFVMSTLKFLSPWLVISLLPQLSFSGGWDYYFVLVVDIPKRYSQGWLRNSIFLEITGWKVLKRILDIHADWSSHSVYDWCSSWKRR